MPDFLATVDFKDMFLAADHLRIRFPHCQVCFTGPDGNKISNPEPPFRLKFPKALKSSTHALPGNTNSAKDEQNDVHMVDAGSELEKLIVEAYVPPTIQVHTPKISLERPPLNLHPPRLEPSSLV